MQWIRENIATLFFILFITILTVFDLFANVGLSANMDGFPHITTLAMFHNAITAGEFPITWIDGFANYGMPLPLISHQLPTYLGVVFNFIFNDPVRSYNAVCFVGLLLSNVFFYIFLRFYFNKSASIIGVIVYNFAPYRIFNLYIRGALPEAFSSVFLPLTLISLYVLIKKKKIWGLFTLIISVACITLSHPMTLVIFSFVWVPYVLYLIGIENGKLYLRRFVQIPHIKILLLAAFGGIMGLALAGYYIIPLNLELKYFYYGSAESKLTQGQYMGLSNFFDPRWYYYTAQETFPRGHVVQAGLFETVIVLLGFFYVLYKWIFKKGKRNITILEFAVALSILFIFLMTPLSDPLYKHIKLLGNIQFPWRMFSSFVFFPPIIVAYLVNSYTKLWLMVSIVLLFCISRFPELYGKNYTLYPRTTFLFTPYNLHSTNMNTVWTGTTEEYPIQKRKWHILEGEGTIRPVSIKNAQRVYAMDLKTDSNIVDYTFYFPGWEVRVDGQETPIEYQDPDQRGVITYRVPQGKHTVVVEYKDTKVRLLGKIISGCAIIVTIILFVLREKLAIIIFGKKQ